MQGDVQQVVPKSYAEGGIKQLASSSGQAYQGFLPAMEEQSSSSRSPDNLHSPPEPAGSSYSSSVFASVSPALVSPVELCLYSIRYLI